MRCFIDNDRTCTEEVQESEGPRCRMWDRKMRECLIVELVRREVSRVPQVTVIYPDSAPPPEVR